ncbi:MAG: type I methionyl aminopeptidase [Bacteroidaceae bacterium]|nr:type I methionyl aminopeptidase [Bacteroidaceae bacterium]
MIFLKTDDEIELLRAANLLVAGTLAEIARMIKPGVTTLDIDRLAETYIRDHGAVPTFKGFPNPYGADFPCSVCTSVNNVVVHGVPDDKPLQEGDIVSVDCGTKLNGYCGDSCYTFSVGEISEEARRLLKATKEALYKGIAQALPGRRIGDISHAVQTHVESQGYGVLRELVGHGIGREMHEDPQVPNYGKAGNGKVIKNGLCIAIEPMVTQGARDIVLLDDKWSVATRDGLLGAHFEHTIAVHHGKVDILSSFDEIERIENSNH